MKKFLTMLRRPNFKIVFYHRTLNNLLNIAYAVQCSNILEYILIVKMKIHTLWRLWALQQQMMEKLTYKMNHESVQELHLIEWIGFYGLEKKQK